MIDPESGLFWFMVTGTLGVISKAAWDISKRFGVELTMVDLLPMPPPYPPIPRFLYTKPEVLAGLRRK